MKPVKIESIAAFNDNYFWVIHNHHYAVVVDPGDAGPVRDYLLKNKLSLSAILLTHHHADHIGGVAELLANDQVPVYGALADRETRRISTISHGCSQSESIFLDNLTISLEVLEVPGHTSTHIAYYCRQLNSLFCGDTLFGAGCGRLFEGTPEQMLNSLKKIAALPSDTMIYCAHEYTLSNLRFALAAEPRNPALIHRMEQASSTREQGKSTVPSPLALELQTNPFLRGNSPEIIHTLQQQQKIGPAPDEVAVFTALRTWKNNF